MSATSQFTTEFITYIIDVGPYLIAFVLGILVGSLSPTYYAAERMRGFGRAMFSQLPYAPPPGMDKEEALIEATTDDKVVDDLEESEDEDEDRD